jgi:hypothetical protein
MYDKGKETLDDEMNIIDIIRSMRSIKEIQESLKPTIKNSDRKIIKIINEDSENDPENKKSPDA